MAEPISVAIPFAPKVNLIDLPDKFLGQLFKCWKGLLTVILDELDRKYNIEEQGLEKYSISKFMRYQIVEDRFVAEQTHEIINIEHTLADAEMKLPEKFLVMSIVDKFSKS
ncbi:UNVERIFIED_CONTAM: hypothetical protein Slati_3855100 [Sesamum latifolium]|uniref:Uncharacterized protein n=1 Tax=Sesamum latifolium TaxID=2727402 RepID=A0AAW2TM83_9LAMI